MSDLHRRQGLVEPAVQGGDVADPQGFLVALVGRIGHDWPLAGGITWSDVPISSTRSAFWT